MLELPVLQEFFREKMDVPPTPSVYGLCKGLRMGLLKLCSRGQPPGGK